MRQPIFRRLTAHLCLLALLCGILTVPAGAGRFQDVPDSHWAATAIERCAAQGWFQGKSADTFGVGQPMTRAGFAVALSRFFGWQSQGTYYQIFSDVPEDAWYEPALRACYEHGAVTRQTTDFRPGDAITREELAVMLVRALGYGQLAGLAESDALPFRDVVTNKGHIAMAYELGLSGGVSQDQFAPDRAATREQAAVMLTRLADKLTANETETMVLLRTGEELPTLTGNETIILMGGVLAGGQTPRFAASEGAEARQATAETARAAGCRVLLGVSGQASVLKAGVSSAAALVQALDETGFDGLYLDITQRETKDTDRLTELVRSIRALSSDTLIYTAVNAPVRGETSPDFTALGKAADKLMLRVPACEDTEGAVPVLAMEPMEAVYYALSVLNDQVSPEKLSLCLTTTGIALKGKRTASLSGTEVAELAKTHTVCYSERYACAYLETKDTTVWYLNEQALAARWQLLRCFGVSSICLSALNGTLPPNEAA